MTRQSVQGVDVVQCKHHSIVLNGGYDNGPIRQLDKEFVSILQILKCPCLVVFVR